MSSATGQISEGDRGHAPKREPSIVTFDPLRLFGLAAAAVSFGDKGSAARWRVRTLFTGLAAFARINEDTSPSQAAVLLLLGRQLRGGDAPLQARATALRRKGYVG